MEMIFWNTILSFTSALCLWLVKMFWAELQRVQILLNSTREKIARENITQDELDRISVYLDQRFNKLEAKIDNLTQRSNR